MYPIDLQTILRVLSHQSGELQATVKQVAGIKGTCQASVILSSGKVVSCVIYYDETPVLTGEEAFRILVGKGTLEWNYLPASSPSPTRSFPTELSPRLQSEQLSPHVQTLGESASMLPQRQNSEESISPSTVPVQTQRVEMEVLATWPRPYRFVYQLSIGDKTAAEIAQLLSLSPEQMSVVLIFLKRRGIVALR